MDKGIEKIVLCVDNSEASSNASDTALKLSKAFKSEVVGIHGYNATMHQGAFKIMEPTLPEKYRKEDMLTKQRGVHEKLIRMGLEKISLSYLRPIEDKFNQSTVSYRSRVKEGKNYKVLNEMIAEENSDLVIMGSAGFNANGNNFVGSVCLRVLRANNNNFLITRGGMDLEAPKFVVCLDGSASSNYALLMAKRLGDKFGAEFHLIYVYDSNLHKDLFNRLKESMIDKEGFKFNTAEQEDIHDEFIDKGLERVGRMILEKSESQIFTNGHQTATLEGWGLVGEKNHYSCSKRILEGPIYKRVCDYASDVGASMVFLGRTGRHYADDMDIGSVAENIVRYAPCNVFVSKHMEYKGWEL